VVGVVTAIVGWWCKFRRKFRFARVYGVQVPEMCCGKYHASKAGISFLVWWVRWKQGEMGGIRTVSPLSVYICSGFLVGGGWWWVRRFMYVVRGGEGTYLGRTVQVHTMWKGPCLGQGYFSLPLSG
jgi:hypothetical protein